MSGTEGRAASGSEDHREEQSGAAHIRPTAILVPGMHRSGTSAVTRVLSLLGASLPKVLLSANPTNVAGHWESEELMAVHDALLESAGSCWHDWSEFNPEWTGSPVAAGFKSRILEILARDFDHSSLFVLKDPRICRFVPFWLDIIEDFGANPVCVLPVRGPTEVAASLRQRDGFLPPKSYLLWLRHVLDAEASTRSVPRVVITYDSLLEDWRAVIARIAAELSLAWPRRSATAEVEIDRFLQARHRHHRAEEPAVGHPGIAEWVRQTYQALLDLSGDPGAERARARLDEVRAAFSAGCQVFAPAARAAEMASEEAERERRALSAKLRTLEAELQARGEEAAATGERLRATETEASELRNACASLEHTQDRLRLETAKLRAQRADLANTINGFHTSAVWQLVAPLGSLEKRHPGLVRRAAALPKWAWWTASLQLPSRLRLNRLAALVGASGLLDHSWYVQHNPDTADRGAGALVHWLIWGWKEGRDPHPLFATAWYLEQHPELAPLGRNPLEHFLSEGARQGCDPHPLFDTSWYLEQHPDVAAAEINPLRHYLQTGAAQGFDPHPLFDSAWYLSQLPEPHPRNPLVHYLEHGADEGLDPNPYFSTITYLGDYAEVRATGENPLAHFDRCGRDGSCNPGPNFDAKWYLTLYRDVVRSGRNPLEHYLQTGRREGRLPAPGVRDRGVDEAGAHPAGAPANPYLELYRSYLADAHDGRVGAAYAPDTEASVAAEELAVKAIAFYLPQFQPMFGPGGEPAQDCTLWTDVSKAVAQFPGHYQPHLPGELGFYDLRIGEVLVRQAALARKYGIHGFCYLYHWPDGKRLLQRPLQEMLADPQIDLPFCLCWVVGNLTTGWEGPDAAMAGAREQQPESDIRFIEDVAPLLRDPRYIRYHERPILVVSEANRLPNPGESARRWKTRCRELGLTDPYLVMAQTFGLEDPRAYGFDAALELPPHHLHSDEITPQVPRLNPEFGGRIFDYRSILTHFDAVPPSYTRYRCVFPSWDTEPHQPGNGAIYAGSSPERYGLWLETVCAEAAAREHDAERLVFINAWNAWATGAHLEPDRHYGYAYLHSTAEALSKFRQQRDGGGIAWLTPEPHTKRAEVAVFVHLAQGEFWGELRGYLDNIPEPFDLFVTVVRAADGALVEAKKPVRAAQLCVAQVVNRGRDIAPFLLMLARFQALDYPLACKLSASDEKSTTDHSPRHGDMLAKLLGSQQIVQEILNLMRGDADLGLMAPTGHLLPAATFWGVGGERERNLFHFRRLAQRLGLSPAEEGFSFPAGSMYWFRVPALAGLAAQGLRVIDFEPECGQPDGTLAHALERLVGLACSSFGWRLAITQEAHGGEVPTAWLQGPGMGVYPYAAATPSGQALGGAVAGIR